MATFMAYCMPGAVDSQTLILTASLQSGLISPHSIDEEMEAQGCEVICPRSKSHADKQPDLGLKPRSRWWQN